jgi:DHA1 family multidrug resistance protein-like MFS transporter
VLLLGAGLAASVLAWTVYHGFEVLLPVSLTEVHGYPPAAWGVLFLVNPVLVVLFQVRVVRWTAGLSRRARLTAAMACMGASFAALPLGASLPLVVAGMVVFVLGEMLWGPTAQGLMTALAPPGARGAVMGVLASTTTAGSALASGAGLAILGAAGDTAMWAWVGAMAAAGAACFWVAARPRPEAGAAPAHHLAAPTEGVAAP